MTITAKRVTIYVAADGSEHPTHEAAALRNVRGEIYQLFEQHAAYREIDTGEAADLVVKHWGRLVAIMDAAGAHAVAGPKRKKAKAP